MIDYLRVKQILDEAVNGENFGAHGPFWRSLTRDQFIAKSVFGRKLIASNPDGTFDPEASNLIKALEGRPPFGDDLQPHTPGAIWPRMPHGYPPVPAERINEIRAWIAAGCPEQAVTENAWIDFDAGGPLDDPTPHNDYWRDFDNWALHQASPQTMEDVDTFFGVAQTWWALAHDPAQEPAWIAALNTPAVGVAIQRLEQRQRDTVTAHYGHPVPLRTLLDGFERFGDDTLPNDLQRPQDQRHNMNGRSMWFFWSAFADGCVRLSAAGAIPAEFWRGMMRALLIGLLNDGLFRGRFPVNGFDATPGGKAQVRAHVTNVPDAGLPQALAQRFLDSGIG